MRMMMVTNIQKHEIDRRYSCLTLWGREHWYSRSSGLRPISRNVCTVVQSNSEREGEMYLFPFNGSAKQTGWTSFRIRHVSIFESTKY